MGLNNTNIEFFIERYVGDACGGSDNGGFISDLKTVRGVKNRIIKGVYRSGEWVIHRCTYTISGRSYEEVGRVTKR
jgi:hypothetical protein